MYTGQIAVVDRTTMGPTLREISISMPMIARSTPQAMNNALTGMLTFQNFSSGSNVNRVD
ncbi:hypothetical protein JCM12296A_55870 [Desulfosarcina cetonica]